MLKGVKEKNTKKKKTVNWHERKRKKNNYDTHDDNLNQ